MKAPRSRRERGIEAAYGRRRPWQSRARARVVWELRRVARRRRDERPADYLELVPGSSDPRVVADVSARVNWYLSDRRVPVYMAGAHGVAFGPQDAPYLQPDLVRDPGWAPERPAGVPEIVLHDVTPRSALRFVRGSRHAALASPWFHIAAEREWFDVQRRYGTRQPPPAAAGVERLLARAAPGGSALVLATGPSAKLLDLSAVDADVRITCNSAVRDHGLLEALRPDVIVFSDRVFHFGPSRYAEAFRRDLRAAMELTDALFAVPADWVGPLLAHVPEVEERLAVMELSRAVPWRWPTPEQPTIRATDNVLTNLMLPIAFAMADEVLLAGCDGRDPGEKYFWKHNASTQYADELMQAAFAAHPRFFADRSYTDYYDEHCANLEALIATGERAGKAVRGLTPSHIPALRRRGAPAFADAVPDEAPRAER